MSDHSSYVDPVAVQDYLASTKETKPPLAAATRALQHFDAPLGVADPIFSGLVRTNGRSREGQLGDPHGLVNRSRIFDNELAVITDAPDGSPVCRTAHFETQLQDSSYVIRAPFGVTGKQQHRSSRALVLDVGGLAIPGVPDVVSAVISAHLGDTGDRLKRAKVDQIRIVAPDGATRREVVNGQRDSRSGVAIAYDGTRVDHFDLEPEAKVAFVESLFVGRAPAEADRSRSPLGGIRRALAPDRVAMKERGSGELYNAAAEAVRRAHPGEELSDATVRSRAHRAAEHCVEQLNEMLLSNRIPWIDRKALDKWRVLTYDRSTGHMAVKLPDSVSPALEKEARQQVVGALASIPLETYGNLMSCRMIPLPKVGFHERPLDLGLRRNGVSHNPLIRYMAGPRVNVGDLLLERSQGDLICKAEFGHGSRETRAFPQMHAELSKESKWPGRGLAAAFFVNLGHVFTGADNRSMGVMGVLGVIAAIRHRKHELRVEGVHPNFDRTADGRRRHVAAGTRAAAGVMAGLGPMDNALRDRGRFEDMDVGDGRNYNDFLASNDLATGGPTDIADADGDATDG